MNANANALSRKGDRMIAVLISVLLICLMFFSLILSSTEEIFAYTKVGDASAKAPEITASSAIMYSDDLDKVLYAKNESGREDPYSITKLITAYIVCDKLDLDSEVTASKNAGNPPAGSSNIELEEGETMTVENLLYGLLIESGNDCAIALAEAVSGSEEEFAKLMTKTAKEWGCKNTSFANASGWQDDDHYTTAEDYLIIAEKAFSNKTIRKITSTKEYTIPATNKSSAREIESHVTLIHARNSGVVRGKTGRWDDDDCSVALQYSKDELNVTLILIGDTKKGRVSDCKKLLAYAHEVAEGYEVVNKKDSVGKLWISGGKHTHIDVYADDTAYAYPASGKESDIDVEIIKGKDVKATLKKGDVVGKCKITVDGKQVAVRNLIVKEDVEKGWFTSAIYMSNQVATLLLIAVAGYVIIVIVAVRKKRLRRARRAQRSADFANERAREHNGEYVGRHSSKR